MRAVVQRVAGSGVRVDGTEVGKIGTGLMILLGVGKGDNEHDAEYLAGKILSLRIFPDEEGKMNRSVSDIRGELLVVSQFTLYGDCRRGTRPGFDKAEKPDRAYELYLYFVKLCRESGLKTETGRFMAMMQVDIVNDGPVTMLLDSTRIF